MRKPLFPTTAYQLYELIWVLESICCSRSKEHVRNAFTWHIKSTATARNFLLLSSLRSAVSRVTVTQMIPGGVSLLGSYVATKAHARTYVRLFGKNNNPVIEEHITKSTSRLLIDPLALRLFQTSDDVPADVRLR